MNDYVISCCSTIDLSETNANELGLKIASFHYTMEDNEYPDDFYSTMSYEEFYNKIVSGVVSTTSQVSTGEFIDHFSKILDSGKDLIHFSLSSGISGVYNSATAAVKELKNKYPERIIYIVDTLCASAGYGLFVKEMVDLKNSGMSISDLADYAENKKRNLQHWFCSGDLTSYYRGGRISKGAMVFGTALHICPIMTVDTNGALLPIRKSRGMKKALDGLYDEMVRLADDGLDYSGECYISQSMCEDDANYLADKINYNFKNLKTPVQVFRIGTVIGSHTGKGTVALFFNGKKREFTKE